MLLQNFQYRLQILQISRIYIKHQRSVGLFMYSVCYYIYRKREISSTEYVFNTEINYIVKSRILFKFIINHNNATQKNHLI